ncbi:MAG TPA: uracil-DNA glycosylase [Hungateiclostridium thermocellum]|jgi:uracil-DNA glycosylase family 4|uniref:Type-4 uracil-DNA glycosylase n=2 Tax=Acetivibrio thermocellus TaxID=1515 RepID=A3DK25_ACET2|nr:uracil-DNA glycosylase [Acetivibrio thermocellus]CDG37588.1 uracil-DNA glycosylase superfamily protein [Acetivibrio thermocellus BC1]ABN54304.1 Uracil-DNA glycosylase superfamily [Acetivibrio thermocellus ATCC 27405]ADU73740.1 Uracil-DNA glycosylase superfamily [Acetivibrio thermocellus DSM 1313]ALX07670.1 phage SPO1 DNA polymerase-related protein [Acetivibrio thermocellus AD2]ANV75412.1 phage SPO1 DNA polymerase-related protein [Acetivibrio thermocellus DSM 2360]
MSKSERLKELYDLYRKEFQEREIVLGDGNVNSRLVLIGEAPGKDEVLKSKPFVGAAGKNLAEFLDVLGLKREDIYITNAIKYRLSKVKPETNRVSNRPATKNEILENRSYLLKEIEIINPEYIVTLGNVPLRSVYGDFSISIGEVHGTLTRVEVLGTEFNLFPLYHPASIIYNVKLKEIYNEDLNKLRMIIG